jgi:Cys-tRNA(Pro)/Cys-tRNA(Cys) deacylase
MAKIPRTQAMRALDAKKIGYTIHQFSDNIRDAEQVATALQLSPEQVFKTLVLIHEDDGGLHPLLYMVPGNREVDLKQLARELGIKSVRMATHEQAEKLTGLKVGGISALALLNKGFECYLDSGAERLREVLVSAGQKGIDLQVSVSDLQEATQAKFVQGSRQKAE